MNKPVVLMIMHVAIISGCPVPPLPNTVCGSCGVVGASSCICRAERVK